MTNSLQQEIKNEFEKSCCVCLKSNAEARSETTFRIGGMFEYFIEPNNTEELEKSLKWISHNKFALRVLGAGSNLLVNSKGVKDWTLRLGRGFSFVEKLNEKVFKVGAAYSLSRLARELSMDGYSGLEFAAGIPASLGGALRMNAGAHKGEMASVFNALEAYDPEGNLHRFSLQDLTFAYRYSSLPKDFIVASVELSLTPKTGDSVIRKLNSNLEYRKKTQPLSIPSAGSVFKNPGFEPAQSAGAIIESLGLKGEKIGNAEISKLHANWIVNPGKNASSSDVIELIEISKTRAKKELSIDLQAELVMW